MYNATYDPALCVCVCVYMYGIYVCGIRMCVCLVYVCGVHVCVRCVCRCTNAMFHSSLEALGQMSEAELQELFREAPFHQLLLEPGTTVLEACHQAGAISPGPRG